MYSFVVFCLVWMLLWHNARAPIFNPFNILRPTQNDQLSTNDIFTCIFFSCNFGKWLHIPMKFVRRGSIDNMTDAFIWVIFVSELNIVEKLYYRSSYIIEGSVAWQGVRKILLSLLIKKWLDQIFHVMMLNIPQYHQILTKYEVGQFIFPATNEYEPYQSCNSCIPMDPHNIGWQWQSLTTLFIILVDLKKHKKTKACPKTENKFGVMR